MNKIITLAFPLFMAITLQAQETIIDKELKNFVDAVMSLRQNVVVNSVKKGVRNNKQWTLMDELKDRNNAECILTKKTKRLSLVPIINGVLKERYGNNISSKDFIRNHGDSC